jgi:hypothetical protein
VLVAIARGQQATIDFLIDGMGHCQTLCSPGLPEEAFQKRPLDPDGRGNLADISAPGFDTRP